MSLTRSFRLLFVGACALLAISACDQRPEVDAALGPAPTGSAYPALMSTQEIPALDAATSDEELAANAALEARAEALRLRAGALSETQESD